ncbi:MAG TPA: group II intron reverse transcriptase/maturase [Phycisphaerales bacterium]|nr:group II intron reverse transcriptase/maturase [Phycisphaerales bacterium]
MRDGDAEGCAEKRDACPECKGRNPRLAGRGASSGTVTKENSCPEAMELMEAVVGRENMWRALKRVESNKGAPGVDDMPVTELRDYLREHWPRIKEELLEGRYEPSPVRKVEIPKPGGKGMRQLGIPTALDRLIQQALHQVLQPIFEPDFSDHSYGFRPGRSAHDAVRQARAHVAEGRRWVVDMDLEKFFDRVNHDILMSRIARKVKDKRALRLIRRYLRAGIMDDGLVQQRTEGTPQGGPLSPLLSNILLDDLDKELERRSHAFCRYADDCNIYVRTRRSGERVMKSVSRFLEKRLKLKVNLDKSAVDRPRRRKFLGYSMTWHKEPRLKAAPESVKRLKGKLKDLLRRGRGRNLGRFIEEDLTPLLRGWVNYFRLAEVRGVFEELDQWLRRHLRCILWRQWKRSYTRAKNLMRLGLEEERAWRSATNGRGPWWNAGASHMNQALPRKYFDACGLVSLLDQLRKLQCAT